MAARARASTETVAQPKSDAYVGLLGLSLGAMVVGCILLFIDYSQYPTSKPTVPNVQAPARHGPAGAPGVPGVPPAGAPGVPPAGAPGVPPAGANPQQPMPMR